MNTKKLEKRVKQWNARCGNTSCTKDSTLEEVVSYTLPQAKVILEEVKELLAALEDRDETEIKDGVVDVLFTSLRLVSLLKNKYDIFGMAEKVCDNNDLKYTTNEVEICEHDKWDVEGTDICEATVEGVKYYCLKDENGKVRKWKGFPKVELSE